MEAQAENIQEFEIAQEGVLFKLEGLIINYKILSLNKKRGFRLELDLEFNNENTTHLKFKGYAKSKTALKDLIDWGASIGRRIQLNTIVMGLVESHFDIIEGDFQALTDDAKDQDVRIEGLKTIEDGYKISAGVIMRMNGDVIESIVELTEGLKLDTIDFLNIFISAESFLFLLRKIGLQEP